MNFQKKLEKRKKKINQEMEGILNKHLGKLAPSQKEDIRYAVYSGGKRLRPILTLLSCGLFEEKEDKALNYSVAVELSHNFTLVHDDIIDKDQLRRGMETLYSKVGSGKAITEADSLYSLAFKIIVNERDISPNVIVDLLDELSTAMILVSEGQIIDIDSENKYNKLNEEKFLEMVEKKTSELLQAAACGGAMIGGASQREVTHLREYSRNLGIAFQIQDDYLDLVGDQKEIGKDVGSDIISGKSTLIVLDAINSLPKEKKERLNEILISKDNSSEEVKEALDLVKESGSIEYAKKIAQEYSEKARERLEYLPNNKNKVILEDFIDYVIERKK